MQKCSPNPRKAKGVVSLLCFLAFFIDFTSGYMAQRFFIYIEIKLTRAWKKFSSEWGCLRRMFILPRARSRLCNSHVHMFRKMAKCIVLQYDVI